MQFVLELLRNLVSETDPRALIVSKLRTNLHVNLAAVMIDIIIPDVPIYQLKS